MNLKNWAVSPLNKERAAQLAETYNLPPFLAMLLEIRGIREPEQLEEMLGARSPLSDPFLMADMQKAADRIRAALDDFEKIAVYGDYDADGVTATAVLYSYLESCGANVIFYIPERESEGYGLNLGAIDFLHGQQVGLIVTVDNGISSLKEAAYAKSLGMDLVVTDHHRPLQQLPEAAAVVDPYRPDCASPFKALSGVGVAFKLIMALEGEKCDLTGLLENYADLVAIGTIGDVVPLTGENRTFVKAGLELLSRTDRLGLKALLERAGMADRRLTAGNVAFTVVPRINATGRIGSPDRAVRLLFCEDPEEAAAVSAEICDDNDFRRQIETEIFEKALEFLQNDPRRLYDRVLVAVGEDWHHGVIGIVASRLTEHFGKPCMVISRTGGEAKGSGRSVEGFSLFEALCSCSELFTKFGGHPMAAGISLKTENIEPFRRAVNEFAARAGIPAPVLRLDCKLNPAALSAELPQCLEALEPFGAGNPAPLFGLYEMQLQKITPVGEGKHLRLTFSRSGHSVTCMRFHTTPQEFPYLPGDVLDLAVTLECREYRGENTLSVFIRDMKLSHMDTNALILGRLTYEKWKRGERLTAQEAERLLPARGEFAALYRFLRGQGGWDQSVLVLLHRLGCPQIGLDKLLVALEVLAEHGLITLRMDGELACAALKDVTEKVDLFRSDILETIHHLKGGE